MIISRKSKRYLRNICRINNVKLPVQYEQSLMKYSNMCKKYNYKLYFSYGLLRPVEKNTLTANAGFFKWSPIIVSPEWAYQLLINKNNSIEIAFIETLGHELTHKMGNINGLSKFRLWTNEVHCDYNSAHLFLNDNRKDLLMAIETKILLGDKKLDQKGYSHPTWRQRIDYITNYDYNEKLIRRIVKDTNYHNEKTNTKCSGSFF